MSRPASIISEIESALHNGSSEKRVTLMLRVTDLFATNATNFTEDQTTLFDDVMSHLIKQIEQRALAVLSERLAAIPNAPAETVRRLAHNDAIEVSGPILSQSQRLTDKDLVEIVSSKSQAHLSKIASRAQINEIVTDALVDHGNAEVANEVAGNAGAKFSGLGMAKLVMRADGDDRLTETMSRRVDIPGHLFRQLLAQATEAVRQRLLATARPEMRGTIADIIKQVSEELSKQLTTPRDYVAAQRFVGVFAQDTEVVKTKILEFADSDRVAETATALSLLTGVPVEQVDRLFDEVNGFGLMILCKAAALEWRTAYSVILARPSAGGMQTTPLDDMEEQYKALTVASAQRVLNFWQGRQKVARHTTKA